MRCKTENFSSRIGNLCPADGWHQTEEEEMKKKTRDET